jgi:hypothetical protein
MSIIASHDCAKNESMIWLLIADLQNPLHNPLLVMRFSMHKNSLNNIARILMLRKFEQ